MTAGHVRTVRALAGERERVQLVYAFGSRAKGGFRGDSDLDLAIVLSEDRDDTALGHWVGHHATWEDQLGAALPFPASLKMQDPEDAIAAAAVREHGPLIYSASLYGPHG